MAGRENANQLFYSLTENGVEKKIVEMISGGMRKEDILQELIELVEEDGS